MIKLKDINKTYQGAQPLHVLKGINLDIDKGEFVSIMGASGSGKSPCSTSSASSTTMIRANTGSPIRSSRTSPRRVQPNIATA